MNRLVGKKLKSKSGASVALAILVFLVCALVGSTILAAATSSSGTLTTTWGADKDSYALKSAAKILKPSFEGQVWTADTTKLVNGKLPAVSTADLKTLYDAMSTTTYNGAQADVNLTFTVGNADTANGNTVKVSITMDSSYNVTAVFTKDGATRKVTEYFPAATASGDQTQAQGTKVSWETGIITIQ